MRLNPKMKVVIDTNVYIVAALDLAEGVNSAEVKTIKAAGKKFKVVICKEILEQIMRVAKRVGDKDLGSRIIAALWTDTSPVFVEVYDEVVKAYEDKIPRKDLAVFAAGLIAKADYLVSVDREFLKSAKNAQNVFKCVTPEEFVEILKL